MQGRLRDGGGIGLAVAREIWGKKGPCAAAGLYVLAGGATSHPAPARVIGVRVVPVGARVVKQWPVKKSSNSLVFVHCRNGLA